MADLGLDLRGSLEINITRMGFDLVDLLWRD